MDELREELRQLKEQLRQVAPPPANPEDNVMLTEARIGPAVRDYIPPELADRFPDLVQGAGRPDFIPDRAYLEKKPRARISRFQEEFGIMADPDHPPIKRKTAPYLNPLTGEREVPKEQAKGTINVQKSGPKPGAKKKGRPKKAVKHGDPVNDVQQSPAS